MEARQIKTKEERLEAGKISLFAFHDRCTDLEELEKQCGTEPPFELWGAFCEDKTMAAQVINHRFSTFFDGNRIENGGIGGVATLPEYREEGAVRSIFSKLLPHAYLNGEVISTLSPFSHSFYRKFGYETVCYRNDYELSSEILRDYHFNGTVKLWKNGESVRDFTALYHRFAKDKNLAVFRDDSRMRGAHMQGDYLKDRRFCYLFRNEKGPIAYLIFLDVYHDPAAILKVEDLAFDGREGLEAILGFLSRFRSDYGTIQLRLPSGIELLSLIQSENSYDIKKETRQDYMVRVVNAGKLLSLMKKPVNSEFVIRVTGDSEIPENNDTFLVGNEAAKQTEKAPDLEVSIQALAQMAVGAIDLEEAFLRNDVTVFSNEDLLRKIFVRKKIYTAEDF